MRRILVATLAVALATGSCVSGPDDVSGSVPSDRTTSTVTPTTDSTGSSSTTAPPGPEGDLSEWASHLVDVALGDDGRLVVAAPAGVALLDSSSGWEEVGLTGLPLGAFDADPAMNRLVTSVATGPGGTVWAAGDSYSSRDDEAFGGTVDEWISARRLAWIARRDCGVGACTWTAFTSDDHPELSGGIGDLVVDEGGRLIASVGSDSLVTVDGAEWTVTRVPGVPGNTFPWSGSLAVDADGTVFAGVNLGEAPESGILVSVAEDEVSAIGGLLGDERTGDLMIEVTVGDDGSVWAATDRLYQDLSTAGPDEAAGIVRLQGEEHTLYTMDDGLLSNDAFVAAGEGGAVWAIHAEVAPTGYSRFDGGRWIPIPVDLDGGGFRSVVAPDGTLWWISGDGGLASFDGLTHIQYASPFQPGPSGFSPDPAVVRRRTVCGWISAEEVASLVAEEFGWTGPVRTRPETDRVCGWALQGDAEEGMVMVSDAALWESFGGGHYDLGRFQPTDHPGGPVDIGATAIGHPALSDGVVVHNGGFGQFAFWRRPGRWLAVLVTVPGEEWDEEYEARFFAIADQLLQRVGWAADDD